MNFILATSPAHLAGLAADHFTDIVVQNPAAVIGLPTGQTPLGLYRELVGRVARGLRLAEATFVTLDEYLGVAATDPVSLTGWLTRAFLEPAGVRDDHVLRFAATAPDPTAACARFEAALAELGGLDAVFLGIGENGHIGFNEPGSPRDSRTRLVRLTETSRQANAAYWPQGATVPRHALTMGVATILAARRIVLLAAGASKAEILARALEGPITEEVPASLLRLAGDRFLCLADTAAAAGLRTLP